MQENPQILRKVRERYMTAISNFTQAMKELTGFDEETAKPERQEKKPEPKKAEKEEIKISKKLDLGVPVYDEKNGSLVTSSMVINGNIVSSDQVKIDGKITGNLKTSESTIIDGSVLGDIESKNLTVSGSIKGNLNIEADTNVGNTAVIVGDIKSDNLLLKGKVKGNLKVVRTTGICENAILSGDIETSELYTEKGCIIHGTIVTKDTEAFNFDEEKLFNIGE